MKALPTLLVALSIFLTSCGHDDPVPVQTGVGGTVPCPTCDVVPCDLVASLTANASQVPTGTPVTYTIGIANNPGNNPATNATATRVQAVLSLPAGNVTFVDADPGCFPTNNTVVCFYEDLVSGASGIRRVTVTPTQAGILQAQVSVTAAEPDADITNNQASLSLTVTGSR